MKKIEVQSVTDEIAESIRKVAEAGKALQNSGLTMSAQVILLQEAIGGSRYIKRDQIFYVLQELPKLADKYLKKG